MFRFASSALLVLGITAGCGDDDGSGPGTDGGTSCTADTECDDGLFCNGAESCNAGACEAGSAPCMAGQTCDEAADGCTTDCGATADADGDGSDAMECGGDDCDDSDAARFPGNTEICDGAGVDEDCDATTFGDRDADGDTFVDALCCNGTTCGEDCNDARRNVHPMASEVCDRIDNECDGSIDEGVGIELYPDMDGDGAGDMTMPTQLRCSNSAHFSPNNVDCNDGDRNINGLQVEICDSLDNDCDGAVDEEARAVLWYTDDDGDGFGTPSGTITVSCPVVPGASLLPTDCDDGDPMSNPAATELCDGRDNDCNGIADFEIAPGNLEDDDLDGVADAMCPGGMGTDCDDSNRRIAPAFADVCDGLDNDCDSTVDEGMAVDWFPDSDGDGYGDDTLLGMSSCPPIPGRSTRTGDCDDSNPAVYPTAPELCADMVDDNDCDGRVDEGASATCPRPPGGVAICAYDACRLTCSGTVRDCNAMVVDGCETDTCNDANNCGVCGRACLGGETCMNGQCMTPDRTTTISGRMENMGIPTPGTVSVRGACPAASTTSSMTTGDWTLTVPQSSTVFIRADSPGRMSTQLGFFMGAMPRTDARVDPVRLSDIMRVETAVGFTQRPELGILQLGFEPSSSFGVELGGISASIDLPHGPAFVFDAMGTPVERTTLLAGVGADAIIFANVAPGWVTATVVETAGFRCSPEPVRGNRWPIEPGVFTTIDYFCTFNCGGTFVDLSSSLTNCGGCGIACMGMTTCRDGLCM